MSINNPQAIYQSSNITGSFPYSEMIYIYSKLVLHSQMFSISPPKKCNVSVGGDVWKSGYARQLIKLTYLCSFIVVKYFKQKR